MLCVSIFLLPIISSVVFFYHFSKGDLYLDSQFTIIEGDVRFQSLSGLNL